MAQESEKDQKTEEATPRRREEAREKGQVAMSQEFVSAIMMCAAIAALAVGGRPTMETLGEVVGGTVSSLGELGTTELSAPDAAALVRHPVLAALGALAMLLLPVVAVGLVVGYGQVGFRIAPKAIAPDPGKIDPIKGMGRLFSARSWVRTGLSALKILAIAACVISVALLHVPDVGRMGDNELGPVLLGMGQVVMRCAFAGVLAMLLISVLDLVFQRLQHSKDLRMTKEEVKEEHKTTEGDPHVKARVRALQREGARRRMMSDVPDATVVVTNPDHYAVALSYPRDAGGEPRVTAPKVVAKGADHIAQRIKEVAREHGVLCYEDVPLARALYAQVEVGDEIPESFYAAVAAVLNYVYRVEGSLAAV